MNNNDTLDLLQRLCSVSGVSGSEDNLFDTIKEELKEIGTVTKDNLNNIYCTFGSGYHIMLEAHLDEIGMIVTDVTDDGFVKFAKCGGIDSRMLLGYQVVIHSKNDVFGVISTLPPHLQKDDESKKVPDIDDLSIDVGLTKTQAEKIISKGDKITFKRNFTPLINNRLSSSCLDDRSGVATIILAAKQLKDLKNIMITLAFSAEEELGTRGAKVVAFDNNVDEAISVDVSFAYSPQCKKGECGELDKGPMIGVSPILSKDIYNSLIQVANDTKIPYQLEIMSGSTGTNSDVISVTGRGVKSALVSIPQRYMHSPMETVSISDIEMSARLISNYVIKKAGEKDA